MSGNIHYRPEIDGLRTIAVLSVVIYHAEITIYGTAILPGGYLGVDIFFVISGYLISSIILKSLQTNSFSFADFYERRARRILPLLLCVLLVSIPFAWLTLFKRELMEFTDSLLGALFFYSNHVFIVDDYWSLDAKLKPLLHTWSLAVEEQFYLLTPVLLFALYRYLKNHMLLIICGIILASLLFAQWSSGYSPSHAFYLLPARMWELFAGTSLALLQLSRGNPEPNRFSKLLPAAGTLLILGSMFSFSESTRHPSVLTVVPIVGTMLVIYYTTTGEWVTRLLSSSPFVGIGKISYGLYLWHFPLIVFARFLSPDGWQDYKLLLILVSVLIATLTYFTVEQPFRNRKTIALKSVILPSFFVSYSLMIVFVLLTNKNDGFNFRHDSQFPNFVSSGIEFENVYLQERSWSLVRSKLSTFEKDKGHTRVLVIGNSLGKDLFNSFELNSTRYPQIDFAYLLFRCGRDPDNIFESKKYLEADVIVTNLHCSTKHTKKIQDDGKKIVFVSGHLRIKTLTVEDEDLRTRYLRSGKWGGLTLIDQQLMHSSKIDKPMLERVAFDNSNYFKIKAETPPKEIVRFIDLNPVQCDEVRSSCLVLTPDHKKVHYDAVHWTLSGARYFGGLIADRRLLDKVLQ